MRLAFDVDDETVASIHLPGEGEPWHRLAVSPLMAVWGRPCVGVDTEDRNGRALWLLTAEHKWQRIYDHRRSTRLQRYSIDGVWDCGGTLAMFLRLSPREDGMYDKLLLYCTETKKLRELSLLRSLTPECSSDYALCWGYKPTLVSPGSVVGDGELNQDEESRRHRTADIMAALKPVNERDRRKGHKETLDTVCFMEFLVRIMQKLPENVEDVIGMPLLKSKLSGYYSFFKKRVYGSYSDSDSGSGSDSGLDLDFGFDD